MGVGVTDGLPAAHPLPQPHIECIFIKYGVGNSTHTGCAKYEEYRNFIFAFVWLCHDCLIAYNACKVALYVSAHTDC